jgi:hypothetical protein
MSWPELSLASLRRARVALALLLVVDLLDRLRAWTAFYTDAGILPRSVYYAQVDRTYAYCASMASDQLVGHLLMVLAGLFSLWTLGRGRRWGTLLAWLWLLTLHNRNPMLLDDSDNLARHLLFFALFLPWDQPGAGRVKGPATLALALQVAIPFWFSSHYQYLSNYPPAWQGAVYLCLVLFPTLLLFAHTRKLAIVCLVGFLAHNLIAFASPFPLVAGVGLLALWPASSEEEPARDLPAWTQLSLAAMAYVLAWALTDIPDSPLRVSPPLSPVGQLLNLGSKWNKTPPFPYEKRLRLEIEGSDGAIVWQTEPRPSYRWERYYSYLARNPRFAPAFLRYRKLDESSRVWIVETDTGKRTQLK